ncbi:MAG: TlpA family protein disulfide reductase [Deltaproteobacteria bacterium]|nr:TlpA family protein disulfide reductase [Deltaproteobacteria bacterium]
MARFNAHYYMNVLKKTVLVLTVLVLAGGLALQALAAPKSEMAPEFTLKDLSQKKVKLSDFKGKVIILNFFATWCPPCRAEIPELVKIYQGNQAKGLVVLSVSLDTEGVPQVLNKFVKDMKIPYPVLLGTMELVDQYQISGVPTTLIINREGKVHKRYDGLVPGARFISDIGKLL